MDTGSAFVAVAELRLTTAGGTGTVDEVFETTAVGVASTDAVIGPAVETSMGTVDVAAATVFKVLVAGGTETVDEAPDAYLAHSEHSRIVLSTSVTHIGQYTLD